MKTIVSLKGPEFLRACNDVRHAAQRMLDKTGVMEIRKHMPEVNPEWTSAERDAAFAEQSKKNISDMLDRMLDEYPEETYDLLSKMIIREEGEDEPDGFDLLCAALDIVSDKRMINFFLRLARLAQMSTAG